MRVFCTCQDYDFQEALNKLRGAMPALKKAALQAALDVGYKTAYGKAPEDTGELRRSIKKVEHWKNWAAVKTDYPANGKPYYAFAVEYGVVNGRRGSRKARRFMAKGKTAGQRTLKETALRLMQAELSKVER